MRQCRTPCKTRLPQWYFIAQPSARKTLLWMTRSKAALGSIDHPSVIWPITQPYASHSCDRTSSMSLQFAWSKKLAYPHWLLTRVIAKKLQWFYRVHPTLVSRSSETHRNLTKSYRVRGAPQSKYTHTSAIANLQRNDSNSLTKRTSTLHRKWIRTENLESEGSMSHFSMPTSLTRSISFKRSKAGAGRACWWPRQLASLLKPRTSMAGHPVWSPRQASTFTTRTGIIRKNCLVHAG